MKKVVYHVALASLIATTVAPLAQTGNLDFVKNNRLPIFSGILLAFGAGLYITTPYTHEKSLQKYTDMRTTKNALDTIVEKLEQNKDNENSIDVDEQLNQLKEGFAVYRTVSYPSIGNHTMGPREHSVFDHYALSAEDIKAIRKACKYFNRNCYKEEQLETIKTIQDRLKNHHIPTTEQLESNKKWSYRASAICATLGTIGLLSNAYLKYA